MYMLLSDIIQFSFIYLYVPLCVGGSKGKAGIHLKYYLENRDTFEMYLGVGGKSVRQENVSGGYIFLGNSVLPDRIYCPP